MQQDHQYPLRLLRALLLIFVAFAVSACANRPKQIDSSRPYTVTEVRVIADRVDHSHFAARLQERLEASVGRATADVGQTSTLRILVLDRKAAPSPIQFFGGTTQSVSLDLSLVDSSTGQVQRSQLLSLNFMDFNGAHGETVLINRLTDDIRSLLGLAGHTPYPVGGDKREVVRPNLKPDYNAVVSEDLRTVDPLLNGTVTPTSVVLDVEPEARPKFDYSKPLLEAEPAAQPDVPATNVAPAAPKVVEQMDLRPAREPGNGAAVSDVDTLDEPCVITLDNDCSDPDSR